MLILLTTLAFADRVDLNHADAEALVALPGIGPEKARAIVDWRAHHGEFDALSELEEVPGIGHATLLAISRYATLGTDHSHDAVGTLHPDHAAAEAIDRDQVDINTADSATLAALPGLGPERAAAILADRDAHGPFDSCEDLVRVEGIGPAAVAGLGARCTANR